MVAQTNIEKIRQLSSEIASREFKDKQELIEHAKRIFNMLERPKINKTLIREEFSRFLSKLIEF